MNYGFYDPFRVNQNASHVNPYNAQNPAANINLSPMPYPNVNPNPNPITKSLKDTVLSAIEPLAQYGLKEGKYTSIPHALQETAAIAYLMGMGNDLMTSRRIVESWEIDEKFYRQPYH